MLLRVTTGNTLLLSLQNFRIVVLGISEACKVTVRTLKYKKKIDRISADSLSNYSLAYTLHKNNSRIRISLFILRVYNNIYQKTLFRTFDCFRSTIVNPFYERNQIQRPRSYFHCSQLQADHLAAQPDVRPILYNALHQS